MTVAADASPCLSWLQKPTPLMHLPRETVRFSVIQSEAPGAGKRQEMASPRTITLVALSFALGLFFVFMGTIKLTPRLSKDAYSEMVSIDILAIIVVQGHCSVGYRRGSRSGLNNVRT